MNVTVGVVDGALDAKLVHFEVRVTFILGRDFFGRPAATTLGGWFLLGAAGTVFFFSASALALRAAASFDPCAAISLM